MTLAMHAVSLGYRTGIFGPPPGHVLSIWIGGCQGLWVPSANREPWIGTPEEVLLLFFLAKEIEPS